MYGVPFAIKDNIDVKGFPTTAACPKFKYVPKEDSFVVKSLKAAGAIVIGKTNLDQFATGLVGTRSPYGTPTSAFSDKHISGGSSSGSANVTARGIVPFALGTDTAGSGRVPAQFNNLIGVKPSRGLISGTGVVPACRTLDCVSIFTLCLSDAQLVLNIAAKYDESDSYSREIPKNVPYKFNTLKFGVSKDPKWFGDTLNPKVYEDALEKFKKIGVEVIPINFELMYTLASLLYEGPWVAERYTVIKNLIATEPDALDVTVRTIIKSAEQFTAADCFSSEYMHQDLVRQLKLYLAKYDGLIVPTAPLNPTIVDVLNNPIKLNSQLGTYTNFVNLADMSALAIPAGFRSDNLPFGVTLISNAFNDFALLKLAESFLNIADRTLGATNISSKSSDKIKDPSISLAVVGAHLSGMPLNYQLVDVKATFVKSCQTSANYRLHALAGTTPRKPGLMRVASEGVKILVEIYDVPVERFGEFMMLVPHPLGIGNVELSDGSWVKGFICENVGLENAVDVSSYGGWRSYIEGVTKL